MRDAPPDYLKTISTIEPLGSHRLLFTIQKKRAPIFDRQITLNVSSFKPVKKEHRALII